MQTPFANHAATLARPAKLPQAAALPASIVTYFQTAASQAAPVAISKTIMDSSAAPALLAVQSASTRQFTVQLARATTIILIIVVFLPALIGTSENQCLGNASPVQGYAISAVMIPSAYRVLPISCGRAAV